MLAADPDFEVRLEGASFVRGEADEAADARRVEGLEGVRLEDLSL